MWLINCKSHALESFSSEKVVPGGYAILSHCWGEDELLFDDLKSADASSEEGFKKLEFLCRQALQDGYIYAWIDTACINKTSSAELSEAINSMFRWYQNAACCYVYLEDVEMEPFGLSKVGLPLATEAQLRESRWFTRGWTLQELIAPPSVRFYDREWSLIGDKDTLELVIVQTTRIDVEVLRNSQLLQSMSVAKRMSWAARRSTSRDEDQSYSLLGIFDVAMPLLYGEGGEKAFRRLQEEIIRSSTAGDHSILAWLAWDGMAEAIRSSQMSAEVSQTAQQGILSPLPYGFRHAHNVVSWVLPQPESFELSYHGLRIHVYIKETRLAHEQISGKQHRPKRMELV